MALLDRIHVHFEAQEPWPKDVKLFQPYEVEQILLPDNANCLAVQAFLKMCNLDFQIESRSNAEFMSPTGKVPFIKCGAFVVAELEGIVSFVAQKGISLTDQLEDEQKSDMRAYQALINNVLGNAENWVCWCDIETYTEVTKPRNGSVYPWPLNLIQTWTKRSRQTKHLKTLGWHDKTLKEVFQEVETCCQALTDRLENNTYFFGKKYTELDALLYGHVYTLLTTPIPAGGNTIAMLIYKYEKLVSLIKAVDRDVMGRKTEFDVCEWPQIKRYRLFGAKSRSINRMSDNDTSVRNIIDTDTEQLVTRSSAPIDTSDEVTDVTILRESPAVADTRAAQSRVHVVDETNILENDETVELVDDDELPGEGVGDTRAENEWCFIDCKKKNEAHADGASGGYTQ